MNTYKIIVTKYSKPWCEIIIDSGAKSDHIVADGFAQRFPESEGFRLSYLKANTEKRLLESSPQGLKVIAREPIFTAYDLPKTAKAVNN